MKFAIVIPAHNEAEFIGQTLESLIAQTLQPHHVVVVNDNSSDQTGSIVLKYSEKHSWIELVDIESSNNHLPGSKIIRAFNEGYLILNKSYDVVCKFDADLIFPENYLEKLAFHFQSDDKVGMAAGFCYIKSDTDWQLENLTRKDHIRGALKAYRKQCYEDIGGLKSAMGWDTIDELHAQYCGWNIVTDESLKVKHLKPTGSSYNKKAKLLQGEAMYKMRYGLVITAISGLKLSFRKKKPMLFFDYLQGYLKAQSKDEDYLVSKELGDFIRNKRWQGIKKKLL